MSLRFDCLQFPKNCLHATAALAVLILLVSSAEGQDAEPNDAAASSPEWRIPSSAVIRDLLADRIDRQGQDVGIVVGVIEPAGRRIVSYGESGAPDGGPLNGDTVFWVGSVTKLFTTLLLADMVESGDVALDDALLTHLPEASVVSPGRPITLLDLATHYSALPSMPTNFDLSASPNPYEGYSMDDLYEFLATYELARGPGERWEYSNLGVSVLGHALARNAGMSYERLLATRVLDPLGLDSSSITLTPQLRGRLAQGHDMYLNPVATWELPTLPGSGALRSTANDLLSFLESYLGYRETGMENAIAAQLAYRRSVSGPISGALGWAIRQMGDEEIIFHDGGKAGYRSMVAFNARARAGVVVLANSRSRGRLEGLAMHLLTGQPLQDLPQPPVREVVAMSPGEMDAYAGNFELESGGVVEVVRVGSNLLYQSPGDGVTVFLPQGPKTFFSNTSELQLEFLQDEDNRVEGIAIRAGGSETRAVRLR